ncbi:hypothetical protein [Ileibacterium valens]|uniref:hypothetical protein n=1 Tax=Ileibacterium valens TaxID=1862668 RepID=UPI00272ADF2E|nr:hypothetical protein [Ileibacterium valens]
MKQIKQWELVAGCLFLGLGLGCIFYPSLNADLFFYLVAGALSISAGVFWFQAIRKPQGFMIASALICTIGAIILWMHRLESEDLIINCFAFYMFFNMFCEGVQWFLDVRDRSNHVWAHALMTVVYGFLCFFSWFYKDMDSRILMRLFGIYLLIQAFQMFNQIYAFSHPQSSRSYTFARWTALPVYFVSVLPSLILRYMLLNKMKGKKADYSERKNDQEVNLRVFIHTGLKSEHIFGHMTFSYQGIMFSYGNYDKEEEKFFRSVGPGIFFTVPANIYINNSCIYEGSTLFEYGLHIDPQQEAKLEELVRDIFNHTYRWYSPIEQDPLGREHFHKYESDYASRLSFRTGAKFRKFYSSQWKTYWILGDNCSLFASDLLSQIDPGIVHKSGVVTPGEYFEFFEECFADPKSNVVYKAWYSAEVPSTLYPTLA